MLKRMLTSVPIAVIVTGALGIGMVKMIAVEFKAQPKSEMTEFEINPVKIDIPPPKRDHILEDRKQVIIPPAMPTIERSKADKPRVDIVSVDTNIPMFKPMPIDRGTFRITVADKDAQPIFRQGGVIPTRASKSGHCKMRFSVSAEGSPFNIQALNCSEALFERNSIKAVQKFKYHPKILDGRAVAMQGVETTIRYNLLDEQGRLILE